MKPILSSRSMARMVLLLAFVCCAGCTTSGGTCSITTGKWVIDEQRTLHEYLSLHGLTRSAFSFEEPLSITVSAGEIVWEYSGLSMVTKYSIAQCKGRDVVVSTVDEQDETVDFAIRNTRHGVALSVPDCARHKALCRSVIARGTYANCSVHGGCRSRTEADLQALVDLVAAMPAPKWIYFNEVRL